MGFASDEAPVQSRRTNQRQLPNMKVASIVAVALLSLIVAPAQAKLPVQVLVGSLCPDAIRFIQNQLNPLYPHIKDYVDLSFIPFGKAHSVGTSEDTPNRPRC